MAGRHRMGVVGIVVCALSAAPAHARVEADTAAVGERLAKFTLKRLGATPASVQAGRGFRVTGRVANAKRRRAQTGRLTFSLRRSRAATARREQRLGGTNVKRTKGGRSRRFSYRLTVPRGTPAGRYFFFACVRRGSGTLRASCKARRITVTPLSSLGNDIILPPAPPPMPAPPAGDGGAQRSLRAPVTGENFYFVMADRFANGDTANDAGGPTPDPAGRSTHGYDPARKGYYHGGDLKGLLSKLDYIEGLGTTAIWLTPSFKNKPVQGTGSNESAGYHGYWITDFTQIDPHLGTNQDLANLVDAAHGRGMKVFFDIITNHTADVITYRQKSGGPAPYAYVSKDASPYRDAAGNPFDDRDFAGGSTFPALSAAVSYPFVPQNPAGSETPGNVNHKVPEWLNDVNRYHNRGDTTFVGEDAQYGDFFGLDDLFTEQPFVVDGMADIYEKWITDFRIDGFRIDTMKHVDDEFWKKFAPRVLDHARAQGKGEFMMFGEVFDTTKRYTSHFTTQGRVQSVLDFPFQAAAQAFAAGSGSTDALRDFFVGDDWYTDADSNVYQLPTFLGNHDMGRIGLFIRQANGGATDGEVLARDRLAHELMYFSRGNPVIYYGDEQGFVGDGGDQDARQDMFPSQVATYNDDDNIGTTETPAQDNFDTDHDLYEGIAELAGVAAAHPALRDGTHQHRLSSGSGAGIYAFSRHDVDDGREYVVALNSAEQPRTALVPTSAGRGAAFERVYGPAGSAPASTTNQGEELPVAVPALSTVVYRSVAPIPKSGSAPGVFVDPLPEGGEARDRAEVAAFVQGGSFYDVTFQARLPGGDWTPIGTDDNRPYRVFHDIAGLEPGTPVEYRAIVLDNAGNSRASEPGALTVAPPAIALTSPPDGGARQRVALAAEATPDHSNYAVTFERRVGGGGWTAIATDGSQPAYTHSDDISGLSPGTQVRYRATLAYAPGKTVTSAERTVTVTAPVTQLKIHYKRSAGGYASWGLHLWGDGLAAGEATASWDDPTEFESSDSYGALHVIDIADDTKQVGFIVHGQPPNQNTKDPTDSPDRFVTPASTPEIWLKQGETTVYTSQPPG